MDGAAAMTNTTKTETSEEGGSVQGQQLHQIHMDFLRADQSSEADSLDIDHGGDTSHHAETIGSELPSDLESTQCSKQILLPTPAPGLFNVQ